MPAYTTPEELKDALNNVDYPADKEELHQAARGNGADEQTVQALRALPPVDYHSFTEVLASVNILDEDQEVVAAERAQRRRLHTHPGLAEHAKDVPTASPITEELGENRGS